MNVLLAHDGSQSADLALQLVASLAVPPETAVEVLRVHQQLAADLQRPASSDLAVHQRLRQEATDQLEASVGALAGGGRRVTSALKEGRPASVIVDEAHRVAADLVVVGSRGRGPVTSTLLGSVAAEVVDHVSCPVLIARGAAVTGIVLAEDGSEGARKAEDAIERWPFLSRLPVRVVGVVDTAALGYDANGYGGAGLAQIFEALSDACEQLAADGAARLAARGVKASPEVRVGSIAFELIDAARQAPADLIVVGSHGRTGVARLLLGSVARSVLHHAPCSVLIVRE